MIVFATLYGTKSITLEKNLQGTTNNVRITFSVGDTTPGFMISIEEDNQKC